MQYNRIAVKAFAFILKVSNALFSFVWYLYYQNFSMLACLDVSMLT